jgi:hypothetical protein
MMGQVNRLILGYSAAMLNVSCPVCFWSIDVSSEEVEEF